MFFFHFFLGHWLGMTWFMHSILCIQPCLQSWVLFLLLPTNVYHGSAIKFRDNSAKEEIMIVAYAVKRVVAGAYLPLSVYSLCYYSVCFYSWTDWDAPSSWDGSSRELAAQWASTANWDALQGRFISLPKENTVGWENTLISRTSGPIDKRFVVTAHWFDTVEWQTVQKTMASTATGCVDYF